MTNAILFLPETVTLLTALAVFLCIIFKASVPGTARVALGGSALILGACLYTIGESGEPFFPGIYRVDFFSQLLKTVFAVGLLLVLVLGHSPPTLRRDARREFPLFLLISTAGMMLLVSATELLTLYLALELSAFPVYALVALNREKRSGSESAVKYMLQGMVASAATLYGMSFLFGMTGTTYLAELAAAVPEVAGQPLFWVGLLLTLAGFLFKIALFPFHFWAPDTYQASAHPVVTFIATASKVAAIGVLARIVATFAMGEESIGTEGMQVLIVCFSVAAMTLGNLAALVQKDVKRLLGYSAVAHAGYLAVGLQAFSDLGLTSVLFYTIGYFAMTYLCFLVVCEVGRDRDSVPVEAMAGLWHRSPFLALCLLIGILGLTGLPPTVGFIGKWFLFSAALEGGQFLLVLIAALNSAIAIYYYLRVLRAAYMLEATDETRLSPAPLAAAGAVLSCVVVLWMGSVPNFFWEIARGAASAVTMQ